MYDESERGAVRAVNNVDIPTISFRINLHLLPADYVSY